ncbi:MAG TPA: periplasmic heavy metal sensor [Candidatus Tectomicrobia bacterium]
MQKKNSVRMITPRLMVIGLLAVATFVSVAQQTLAAEPPTDPAHAAHVAAAASKAGAQTVDAQLAELRAKIQQLEAIIQQQPGQSPPAGARTMPGMESGAKPMQGGMGGAASRPGREMGMMSMMDKMMGMMDKMMGGMGGSTMPAGAPMGGAAPGGGMMSMDKMEMGGMGGGSSSGGGMGMMDMEKMEMAGMMGMMGGMGGKGGSGMAMPSALPGFPGASHLYHIGATGFFLDHPQHIALSTEQRRMLNQIKEQAALDKASADRSVQEAEQALWTLTAADQPDNAQIEAKVAEIEKLRGDARLRFIGAIGSAAKILNDEQRKILTGFAPPAPAAPMPAGGMKGM